MPAVTAHALNTSFDLDEQIGLIASLAPRTPVPGTMGLKIDWNFDDAFSTRKSSIFPFTPATPPYKVSIAGKSYAVDLSFEPYRREAYRHRSIISQRESLNFDNISGENVVNTSGLWRRNFIDWSLGAGQLFSDHRRSAENRYHDSKGVNPWVPWQLSLHHDTALKYPVTSVDRWCRIHSAGPFQYVLQHNSLVFFDTRVNNYYNYPTIVGGLPAVGGPASYYQGITHNDSYLFIACGSSGVYYVPLGSNAAARYVAVGNVTSGGVTYDIDGFDSVFWGADNLWATSQQFVLNFGGAQAWTPGTAPGVNQLMAVNVGSNWRWTGWAEGNSQIYLGGYESIGGVVSRGSVYRIGEQIQQAAVGSVTTTSTTYYAPVQALPLPPGEYPTALYPYLNYVILGTNRGIRVCETLSLYDPTATSTGDLKSGPYIPVNPDTDGPLLGRPVTSITANDKFVYFAWNNYDGTSTGLGRANIAQFIDELAPAYSSDLMVTGQGDVYVDWDIVNNAPLIAISGTINAGIYNITNTFVSSGTVTTGWLGFDIPENKTFLDFLPQFSFMPGICRVYVTPDLGTETLIGTWTKAMGNVQQAIDPAIQTDKCMVTVQLYSDAATNLQSPLLNRWTIRAMPNVSSETTISCVIDLFRSVEEDDCVGVFNPYVEFFNLDTFRRNQTIIPFVEGPLSANVIITQIDLLAENRREDEGPEAFNMVCVIYMQTLNGYQISELASA